MPQHKRQLIIAMTTAGIATAGLGATVLPASAQPRTFQVTLASGATLVVTVDVPAGTPIDQIAFPGVSEPIAAVAEITAPAATTETQPPETGTTATTPADTGTTATTPQPPATTQPSTTEQPPAAGGGDAPKGGPTAGEDAKGDGEAPAKPKKPKKDAVEQVTGGVYGPGPGPDDAGRRDESVEERDARERRSPGSSYRTPTGVPTTANPGLSVADIGAAPVGVPNFFIDKFRIPPFLLSIYQAAGIEYGIRWEILAAINEIETDYGRNLNVSSAGALGWMQFMPATWKAYGVDANGDGEKDPYNPVDAIFAAARYLKAAGGDKQLRKAIFAYNHANWYVDSVLMRARIIGGLPAGLVGSLTGLTQGRFPVHAKARYADDLTEAETARRVAKGSNAAMPVESSGRRRGISIYAKKGAPVIAVQDGRIVKIGRSDRLGRYVQLRDAYGNTYTYANLGAIADKHPVAKPGSTTKRDVARELELPKGDPAPTAPASAGRQRADAPRAKRTASTTRSAATVRRTRPAPQRSESAGAPRKERLFADPRRPASYQAGGREQLAGGTVDGPASVTRASGRSGDPATDEALSTFRPYFVGTFKLDPDEAVLKDLKVGSKVIAGTILGRIGEGTAAKASHTLFEIRPAGDGAPRIDPKPILDGWKLLETTAVYRARGRNPFFGSDAKRPSIGQILLMSKDQLERRVLANPRVEIYACGRRDIRAGKIDRRVLATLEFLAANGLKPTVTSLQCGHGFLTASGNVSHHSSGNAVDIAKVNGIPILGNQGRGSVTDITNRRLLTLQGTMRPAQIISLMKYKNTTNTFSMGDHHDHIHVGFQPLYGSNSKLGRQLNAVLKPKQWIKLIDRLSQIDNPTVRVRPSKHAITVRPKRASDAHAGE